jgi:hypothetical protein
MNMEIVPWFFRMLLARYGNPGTVQFQQGTEGKLRKQPVLLFYVGKEYPYYRVDLSFVDTTVSVNLFT